ncbi:sigma-70 family RNA polymerase sigma factor [Luteolibacter yonseiensis]|uniref:Sigma-70 family RNA polymerase sigma factor n=1 Tax=Luteolibacter yonseiensis TaxID=1144680 RepID=A0A934VBD9_9BACT|nr:sigma-70 family RNA polymerase sigma factor [Luteolibacter yonseiensis]MBK1815319.1 sigma-70 family RNA polymerase sigma factor [Luteolibacter yonseiensis]
MSDHSESDDGTLLNDFRDTRNNAAFTEIVRRYLPLVFHVALRRLGSAALAEEASQHAFARLAAKAGVVSRHPERLRAWLHRTACFEASALARKETRLSRLPVKPEPDTPPMHRPEIYDRLDEALNKLPELDRELVLRHCCGGEDYRRMAAAVGKSEAACQKRVERALVRLGQGLGGARTAGVIAAALAATNVKSQAMPAAEQVAAAALKYQSATGGMAGAFSGMKLGACAVLVLAGGAAGWQPEVKAISPPPETRSLSSRSRAAEMKMVSKNDGEALAPRPASVTRSLDEVLETIQAGRFAPLVEFLPTAKVSDLQAIIDEDDYVSLEGEGGDHFGTARNMALRRWAEIDPEGAFSFAITRERNRRGLGDVQEVFNVWCASDPSAAATAYGALSVRDQVSIIRSVDEPAGDFLAARFPRVAWALEEQRGENLPASLAEAEQVLAMFLNGNSKTPPAYEDGERISRAFEILVNQDPAAAAARAELIPWPQLRAEVLSFIYRNHPPKSSGLPPGLVRFRALENEMVALMGSDPEAAIRKLRSAPPGPDREAIYLAVSRSLAGSDPWRLIDIVRSLDGTLGGESSAVASALSSVGKEDPQRALDALQDISLRIRSREGNLGLARAVLNSWLEKDPVAAIRWAGGADIMLDTEKVTGDPAAVVPLLEDGDLEVRRMALWTLVEKVREKLVAGSAKELLSKMPPSSADQVLGQLAFNKCLAGGELDESLEIVSMASAAKRREMLPELAFHALGADTVRAMPSLKALPKEDREVIAAGIEPYYQNRPEEEVLKIRQSIKQLTP